MEQSVQQSKLEAKEAEPEVLFRIKRHPFGLAVNYLTVLLGLVFAFALIILVANGFEDIPDSFIALGAIAMVVAACLAAFTFAVASYVYWKSALVLTSEEVKQQLQLSLFSKKNSRLGLANVEDVTVSKSGFFSTMLNFGTLYIETAGEQSNFRFTFCPDPDTCAKAVMDARQDYLQKTRAAKDIPR